MMSSRHSATMKPNIFQSEKRAVTMETATRQKDSRRISMSRNINLTCCVLGVAGEHDNYKKQRY